MALINCPECKKKVSEKAKSCPKCGYVITEHDIKEHRKMQKAGGVIWLVIIVIGFGWFLLSGEGEDESGRVLYTKAALNIRSLPSVNSDVIRVTEANEGLYIGDSIADGFRLILDSNGNFHGWASESFLVEEKQAQDDSDANGFLAYSYAEDFVSEKLVSPSTAEFPGTLTKKDHITRVNASTYKIVSWVDSQNAYGAVVRNKFACTIVFEGDVVSLTSLDFY